MTLNTIFNYLINLNWELIIATLAVAISAYSFFSSKKLNKEIGKQQLQINKLLLIKEQQYQNEQNKAEFRAFVNGSKGDYLLTIVNQGKADALNARLEILIDEEYKNCFYDLKLIFPIKISAGHTAKTRYTRGMKFPSKFTIRITWDDDNQRDNSKEIEVIS